MDLLLRLINASGPSGNEQQVRSLIKKEIQNYVSEINIDKFGNLIARKKGTKPTVMLVSHMDEIGLMIKNIDDSGIIYVTGVGGIEPITLLGERIRINTNKSSITGIITTKEISESGYTENIPKMKDIFIDTGLSKDELTKLGVCIGDYVHLLIESSLIGNNEYIIGKALDDRIGCYILIEIAKRLKKNKNEIYYVFTVQEEIGLYGAKTSVYGINPDYAVIVDVTNSDDFSKDFTKKIGKGPCITVKDSQMIGNLCINGWFKDISKRNKIPLQYDISEYGTTDALSISVAKGGIPAGVLSVPIRNIHTTSGLANINDIKNCIRLLEILLKKPPKQCII